ncbi:MAG: TrkA family potassium uptake protein [Gammaproteobacteria bacterium]|nr:TrkA family potassium uptake protein [Gammaproteobacteria bacterium]MBU1656076.1 TrkA family potassium uptake protein [Gammaproteobacteria bacterium]MBU1960345.1 TrkA family potassium uptake protein [Gammaproteobacteria bacterium]
MKAVFVGASSLAVMTARIMLRRGHEVIIVERKRERVEELTNEIDCGLICGDGSTPAILRETGPEQADILYCLTNHDQTNIIASLVGRSLGFRRVVTQIKEPEFEHVCIELGLEDTIVPDQTIGRHLSDMFEGQDPLELSAMIKDDASVFTFVVRAEDEGTLAELSLPKGCLGICHYRDGDFSIPRPDTGLKSGDELVLISHRKYLPQIMERWGPHSHVENQPSKSAESPSG